MRPSVQLPRVSCSRADSKLGLTMSEPPALHPPPVSKHDASFPWVLMPGGLDLLTFSPEYWHSTYSSYVCANFHFFCVFTGRQHRLLHKPCTSHRQDVCLSVCPSVCLSVTHWHWVKTTQARITKSSPTDSPIIVFGQYKADASIRRGDFKRQWGHASCARAAVACWSLFAVCVTNLPDVDFGGDRRKSRSLRR